MALAQSLQGLDIISSPDLFTLDTYITAPVRSVFPHCLIAEASACSLGTLQFSVQLTYELFNRDELIPIESNAPPFQIADACFDLHRLFAAVFEVISSLARSRFESRMLVLSFEHYFTSIIVLLECI